MSDEIRSVTDLDIDALFAKYEAKVVWDDKAVRYRKDGTEEVFDLPPEECGWRLVEKFGSMDLYGLQEIADARLAGALFLYLWGEKKVPVAIAHRCAVAHVKNYTVREVDEDERKMLKKALQKGISFPGTMRKPKAEITTRNEHDHCKNNRRELEESDECACFYCLAHYSPSEITDWCDNGTTALCPRCSIDSVLASASGINLTDDLLKKMQQEWF